MRKHNLSIFVPVNLNCGMPAAPDALEDAILTLCELGGGATITDAEGVWADPATGRTLREPVRIVETDAEGVDSMLWEELGTLARRIGRTLAQDAVYIRLRPTDSAAVTIEGNGPAPASVDVPVESLDDCDECGRAFGSYHRPECGDLDAQRLETLERDQARR